MLWDPTFATWQALGVTTNSQMILLAPTLDEGTPLFFGFDEGVQAQLLEQAAALF